MKEFMLFMFLLLITFCGCVKQKECSYGMTYNAATKDCDCINYAPEEIPELSQNEYNSIGVVNKNFLYLVKKDSDYPYYSHEGDTILVYGWVWEVHPVASDEKVYDLIDQPSVPVGSSCETLPLINLENFLGTFDGNEKCFVKGILEFPFSVMKGEKIVSDEQICHSVKYSIRVIEINNQKL